MKKVLSLLTLLIGTCSAVLASTGTEKIRYSDSLADAQFTGTSISIHGGTSPKYVAGKGSKQSSGMEGKGMKMRTSQSTVVINEVKYNTIVIDVNDTYTITSFKMVAGSNNTTTNVTVKGVYADDDYSTNLIASDVVLTNSTAGTVNVATLSASDNITIAFSTDSYNQINAEFDFGWSKLDIEKLSSPVLSFDGTTGTVTIGDVTNATKITYTTNGSIPTEESTEYDSENKPVVADGTVFKAIAIGDGSSYSNSDVATETVYLTGITVATPVVNQFNGTVVITCATPNATIEYTTDGGANWNTYNRAFTLTANADIQVRANRASCTTSAVADATITAVAANLRTKTIVMGYGAFDVTSKKVLTGKSTDVANGYTLTMLTDQDKSWSGRDKITISEISNTRTTFCGSNGVQCKLDMPVGVKATQLRLYSYVNSATTDTNCAWKEVNGENLNSTLNTVPMGAFSDVADYQANPDLRIFPLDNVEGSLTFTNGGIQTCFVLVLDIVEPISTTLATSGYSSFSSANAVDIANATDASDAKTLKAYTISALSTTSATLSEVTEVPANTGVVLKGTGSEAYSIPVIASAGEVGTNYLKAAVEATSVPANSTYVISGGKICQFTGTEIPAGRAYLLATDVPGTGARELSMLFGEGEATGIQTIETTQKSFLDGDFYNVAGQRVALPTKGLYIVNGKKVVIK